MKKLMMEFQNWSLKILNKWTGIITSTLGSWTPKSAIVGLQAILHGRWGFGQLVVMETYLLFGFRKNRNTLLTIKRMMEKAKMK